MSRKNDYKALPSRFEGDGGRLRRAENLAGRRRQQRAENVARHRQMDLSPEPDSPPENTQNKLMAKLAKWKEDRKLKKKQDLAQKRPPFKVGVPHHKLYSPPVSFKNADEPHRCYRRNRAEEAHAHQPKLISTATQKRLAMKPAVGQNKAQKVKKSPSKPLKNQESPLKATQEEAEPAKEQPLTFGIIPTFSANRDLNETANESVSRSYSPVPAAFSPFIVTSRGKNNARKEQMIRLGLNNSLRDDIPTKDTVMQQLNISAEEEEKTAQYYKYLLENEIKRLSELCETWKKFQENPETTEDGQYLINQAIGQTNLLLNKKFKRFQGLVNDCETGRGEMLVRCRDLQGFWDTLSLEIKNCDTRFENLSEAHANGWVEKNTEVVAADPQPKKRKVTDKKKPTAAVGKSNLRLFIEARRKAAMKDKENVVSPEKSATKATLRRRSSSRLESMIPDTIITAPTPRIEFDSSKIYPNSTQTPGKGILKKPEDLSETIGIKSTLKVNFNDDLSICEDVISPVKPKISSGVEKKLNFDDSPLKNNLPKIVITQASTEFPPPQEEILPEKEESPVARVLRNRSIIRHSTPKTFAPGTPRRKRTSVKSDENSSILTEETPKEQASTSSTPRKIRRSTKSSSIIHESAQENNPVSPVRSPREKATSRRSNRKSIKLDVSDDCTVCLQTLSTPVTPKKKRNASMFSETQCQ